MPISIRPEAVAGFKEALNRARLEQPLFHVVLGSGFGSSLDDFEANNTLTRKGELHFTSIPGLAPSTVPDHAGCYRFYAVGPEQIPVVIQMGRLHGYEGHSAWEVSQTVMIPRAAGIENFVLTNAAGALSPHFNAGDIMLIRDHVNLTGRNPLVGPNPKGHDGEPLGSRFPDMTTLYEGAWLQRIRESMRKQGLRVHEGVYVGVLGPSFETPAEIGLFASWGLQAVGMSTVWEAIALKHSGARVAGLSLISNPGAGLAGNHTLDHEQIVHTCRAAARHIVGGLITFIREEAKSR